MADLRNSKMPIVSNRSSLTALPPLDTRLTYGRYSRFAHWGGALLVLLLLGLGLVFEEMPRGPDRGAVKQLHVALGTLCVVPLLMRIGWRVRSARSGGPDPLSAGVLRFVEKGTHVLLLLVLLVLVLTGPLSIWLEGDPLRVYDWFSVPSPFAQNRGLHRLLERVHGLFANVLIALLVLHVVGALRHGTRALRRMAGRVL